ncbi:hypothetical protein DESUT3_01810 [Desulfuromonas versatilis]|uniref:Permuted papain-like amidase YaeF/Yiix C92 family enzyme n=2 Tax=Desulfuromonas versatilis TaxID=2802975 RepID=A0ABM8HRP8_9BACT|nr:hypothetical protein DESUT3_01810 [Desulfuromonas versatilis]
MDVLSYPILFVKKMAILCILLFLLVPAMAGAQESFEQQLQEDALAIFHARAELQRVMSFVGSRPDIFAVEKVKDARILDRQQRMAAWSAWASLLDAVATLDSLGKEHKGFWRLGDDRQKRASFRLFQASFLTAYRYGLEFIHLADKDPGFDTLLNEAVPEFGLPDRTFASFKFRILNLGRGTEFAALQALSLTFSEGESAALSEAIAEDSAYIWKMGEGRGEALTVQNALKVVEDFGRMAWFPVQKGVSNWMGATRVRRKGDALISLEQIKALQPKLQPGDILLQRREWYMSNLGLPGFWTHVALYVGTPEERKTFFTGDQVQQWVRSLGQADGEFESLLQAQYPTAYARSLQTDKLGDAPRVVEAIAEGVSFTTLEHSAAADSLAVLRPRLPLVAKAAAVKRAFQYSGRPYDFEFDFRTDSALVCSELVFKAYEGGGELPRYRFPLVEILGRPLTPPNEMARQFDAEWGTESAQGELVVFLDGYEKAGLAVEAPVAEFRQSWRRPKWHVLLQDAPLPGG